MTTTFTISSIRKRNGGTQEFTLDKITTAVTKALIETGEGDEVSAKKVSGRVHGLLLDRCEGAIKAPAGSKEAEFCIDGTPGVEEIQDVVEEVLMELDYYDTAKAYILYRNKRKQMRERSLFKKRANIKPYEYPELAEYVDAVRHSYWIHTEFSFTSDIHDYKSNMTEHERQVIKRAMLAIAQIEVAVKTFWGDLFKKMPKPELGRVGQTFAESEVRHMDAYSHLLELLGLNEEFDKLMEVPAIKRRMKYLDDVVALSRTDDDSDYSQSLLLFSLFIEHVSLFSQFLIMMSFNKFKNVFKGVSNVVEATSKEEQIHGLFGIELVNMIRKEHPEWFDDKQKAQVEEMCRECFAVETEIVDWMYEGGDLDFLPKEVVLAFIKHRLNNSLKSTGYEALFEVDQSLVEKTDWFDEEVIATKHVDFFQKRSINYNKRQSSVTSQDLF